MNCLNQIILEGNIVKMDYEEIGDIKLPRVNIVLAVDRKFKDIDFLMPYDEETGEVDDTEWTLEDEPNWDKLADELNKEAERVINQWSYFEIEEEEVA